MKKYKINNNEYELIKDKDDIFDYEEVSSLVTDYFDDFDYIMGDMSYGKIRLKGFNDKKNKNYKKINSIESLDDYLKKYCAYKAKYFLLKKVKKALK
ncbi:MAG: DUF1027 domain-containing protein [Bacilli bacterium]|nr:DUF1027 domain-containing protein [Bacilli bacterium]